MESKTLGNLAKVMVPNTLAEKAHALSGKAASPDAAARQKAAQEFTALLYLEVLKAMRVTLAQDGFVESESLSRDIYTAMFDAEIAQAMAKRDVSGFSKTVERSLERISPPPSQAHTPTQGMVSSPFGLRKDPISGKEKFHQGVDIAAPAGTAVKAVAGGKVVLSGWVAGYGNLVEVDHGDGLVTRYGHNAQNLVSEGEHIQAGQPLALVGSSGRSTGAHLHFEVRRFGKPVTPESFLGDLTKGTKIRSVA
ncbi:MAG TPA: peptidoglycan DD-metalloendopeptidase family protein [Candidatus Binatia bacterium]